MKKIFLALLITTFVIMFSGCTDAQIASQNTSKAADQFEIYRRVVFYNGITDEYILTVEGYCSIQVDSAEDQLELTVKTGPGKYMKHFLGLSDNVTYFVEQLDSAQVSDDRYRVVFKPSAIIPSIQLR